MTPFVQNITNIFSFFVLLGDMVAVALFAVLITPLRRTQSGRALTNFIGERAVLLSFLIALGATLGSLFYSEIAGFAPCVLCWWQRIFLYPQVILLFVGFMKKDQLIRLHSIILSLVGGVIALYHTFIQFGGEAIVPCSATGPSCTTLYFLEYGYITIPTMSLTVFALLLLIMLTPHPKDKQVNEL